MVIEHYERMTYLPDICVSAKFADIFTEFDRFERVDGIFNRTYPEFLDMDTIGQRGHINLSTTEIVAMLNESHGKSNR